MDIRDKKSDFEWVLSQTSDTNTIKYLNTMIENEIKFREEGIQQKGEDLIKLKFKDFSLTTTYAMSHTILHVFPQIFRFRESYVPNDFLTKEDNVLIDVGANEGFYTLYSKLKNPDLTVWCFEPNPHAFKFLQINIAENNLKNVFCINKAIYSSNSILKFELIKQASSIGSIKINRNKNWIKEDMIDLVEVEGIKLDDFYETDLAKTNVDVLKIDVEGFEKEVLFGASTLLKQTRKIELETHSSILEESCKEILLDMGFIVKSVYELHPENRTTFYENSIK